MVIQLSKQAFPPIDPRIPSLEYCDLSQYLIEQRGAINLRCSLDIPPFNEIIQELQPMQSIPQRFRPDIIGTDLNHWAGYIRIPCL